MIGLDRICFLSTALLLPFAACAGNTVYRSVDEAGHVTYSTEPPEDAVKAEVMHVPPGPSEQATETAVERAKDMERKADAQYEALTARRRQEAQARRDAERVRLDREAAARQRRIDESAERLAREPSYYPVYPLYWGTPYPPQPPVHLPHPPWPSHPVASPQRRSHSHINPPTRRW